VVDSERTALEFQMVEPAAPEQSRRSNTLGWRISKKETKTRETQKEAMTLRDFIERLPEFTETTGLYVDESNDFLSGDMKVIALELAGDDGEEGEEDPPDLPGMFFITDVRHIRDVIAGRMQLLEISNPTIEQKIEQLIHYVENNA
jgi:hypothetical protein